jgi:hypothetical protein
MKENKVSLEEKHGQWYARWKSKDKHLNAEGKLVKDQYFEPTNVSVPLPHASDEKRQQAYDLAMNVGCYLRKLRSPNPPPIAVQQAKLKEFALESARLSEDSLKQFAPVYLIHYATTPNQYGHLPTCPAVWKMANSWNLILEGLGDDADLHPSLIPTARLQTVVDSLPGKQLRNAINLRAGFKYAVESGWILEGHDPAVRVKVYKHEVLSHRAYKQAAIQRALCYMEGIPNGDQWQLITLCGVYIPARFATSCRLMIRPVDFVHPQKPGKCAVLDPNAWTVEYYDTKARKWVVQELAPAFVEWCEPYVKKHKLGLGDYVFPEFARLTKAPSERWQKIMEDSGAEMVYEKGRCLSGFQSLRVSWDRWFKENELVAMTPKEIADAGKHGFRVHQTYYDSGTVNIAQQRKENAARPKFLPGNSDLNVLLLELQEKKREQLLALEAIVRREQAVRQQIASERTP